MPSRRHTVTAAPNASWTASSASWKSPTCRIRVASTIERSSRNARAIAAEGSSFDAFYRTPEGKPGGYQDGFLVYGRA